MIYLKFFCHYHNNHLDFHFEIEKTQQLIAKKYYFQFFA